MDELTKLIEQRKEIDRKIKEIKNQAVCSEKAKMELISYPTGIKDWVVKVLIKNKEEKPKWRSVAVCDSREEAIQELNKVICNLKELQRIIFEEDTNNGKL